MLIQCRRCLNLYETPRNPMPVWLYHTVGVTRLLAYFAHWRFLYFHGQDSARLERHKTVYTHPDRERTLLITLLSLCFSWHRKAICENWRKCG
ncbi:hypothetical protein EDB89DRAFT_854257 [Lactarius sanguifluus]|nr:hypothetical protein EDB89DRAFT_854257 [Lactarius sanguifluus]